MVTAASRVAAALHAAEPDNPFDGVVPDFSVFGAEFNDAWEKLLGGLWALAFSAIAIYCVMACVRWVGARNRGYEQGLTDNAHDLRNGLLAAGVCAGLPIIFGAILSVVG